MTFKDLSDNNSLSLQTKFKGMEDIYASKIENKK